MATERSVYFWYYDGSDGKAQQIADIGANRAWIKAGGDGGIAWIKDPAPEGFENEQWDDGYLMPLTSRGIPCFAWFYNDPLTVDQTVVLTALDARWSDTIVLNVETEWRVGTPTSPYNTLAEANAFAERWVNDLKAALKAHFGRVPSIGYSSCDTWADFPIEGFEAACDFAMPQDYWPDNLMAPDGETGSEAGEDMVEAHLRRCGNAKPCIPILTMCGEYPPQQAVAIGANALLDDPDLDGFSAWEAGNSGFQAEAMRLAFALLPPDVSAPAPAHDWPLFRAWAALWKGGITV